ncbi:LytTR family DNA-binding domain-containing protein [Chitinophaga sp. Cy-1792]|uniref:LytR/AlgR family response regulator transcription factor n=1 Tax=Chitinophaga sp. Cy-1792 TaxID=2608339 RepID=UPI0014202311|nr:LytTR family DNA-binding domain-containing protein [Chitinophaga sp. Cy-1792]NIG53392.1 response regulator transcription factor [Chitinophaga sp. Cy-1792]
MINCIVVDDEPLARQLIVSYIDQIADLHCLGCYNTAMEAFTVMQSQPVELMFLDIDMPGINGMNFVKSIRNAPKVIFITAHAEFAVDAFELEAVDYLVKPVSFDRFLKSVQKIVQPGRVDHEERDALQTTSIFLKVDKRLVKVDFSEIRYIEALGDYLKVHTTGGTLVSYITIGKIESLLPASKFIRIHRSTIINASFIQYLEGNFMVVDGIKLSVGLTYKDALVRRLS